MFRLKHLIGTGLSVLFVIAALMLMNKFLKNKNEKIKLIPLQVIAVLLIVMEILKIVYIISVEGYLPRTRIPFYLCSMFLWATPLAAFAKGRAREWGMSFCFHYGLFCGGAALILAGDILGNTDTWRPLSENLLPLHSFFYHALLLVFGFWVVFAGFIKPTRKTAVNSIIMVAVILTVSMILNLTLDTNFTHITKSELNMFYFLVKALTFPVYAIILYLIVFAVSFIFLYSYNLITIKKRRSAPDSADV